MKCLFIKQINIENACKIQSLIPPSIVLETNESNKKLTRTKFKVKK